MVTAAAAAAEAAAVAVMIAPSSMISQFNYVYVILLVITTAAAPVILFTIVLTWSKIILRDSIVALQIFDPDIFRIKYSRDLAPANVFRLIVMDQHN
jgi:hypothetical protein